MFGQAIASAEEGAEAPGELDFRAPPPMNGAGRRGRRRRPPHACVVVEWMRAHGPSGAASIGAEGVAKGRDDMDEVDLDRWLARPAAERLPTHPGARRALAA